MVSSAWARPDPRVQRRRQEVIDHVETLLTIGIVHRRDVSDVDETAVRIVAEVLDHLDDLDGLDINRELVEGHRMTGGGGRKRANDRLPQGVELGVVHDVKP